MNKNIFLICLLITLTGCSFQSIQYEFIKGLLIDEGSQEPIKTWSIYWNDNQTDLYAVNIDNQIIFADNDVNIFYKDQQIYKITGLFADSAILEIESKDPNLIYKLNGKIINNDNCEEKKMTIDDSGFKIYSRVCLEQVSGNIYENRVIVNPMGLVTSLRFKVRANYPSLELSKK